MPGMGHVTEKISGTPLLQPIPDEPRSAAAAWDRVVCSLANEAFGSQTPLSAPRHAPDKPPADVKTHTVVSGECFSCIAHDNGMSRRQMYRANPQFDPRREDGVLQADRGPRGSWDPDYLRPGDKLRVINNAKRSARPSPSHKRAAAHNQATLHPPLPRPRPPVLGPPASPGESPTPPGLLPGPGPQVGGPPPNPGPGPQQGGGNPPQSGSGGQAHSPLMLPAFSLVPAKSGVGLQPSYNASKSDVLAFEYFAKFGWPLGPDWLVTGKVKYASDQAIQRKGGGGMRGFAAGLFRPKKLSIDIGLNSVSTQASGGLSLEFTGLRLPSISPFVGQTDPNTLVDKTKTKIKFANLFKKVSATGGFWQRLGQWARTKIATTEAELAFEGGKQFGDHVRGYLTPTFKASIARIEAALTPSRTSTGFAAGTGTVGGLAAGYLGYQFSDKFLTSDWTHPIAKEAVNQFGGGVSAAYGYALAQKGADWAVGVLDSGTASGALARAAPIVNVARSVWNAGASTAAGKVVGTALSKVGILGLVMPAMAAGQDIRDAYGNMTSGHQAEGWRSAARAGVRAGAALLGTVGVVAAAGALGVSIPVLGVIAAGVGIGLLGDWVAKQI
jgi:hypothetical protein